MRTMSLRALLLLLSLLLCGACMTPSGLQPYPTRLDRARAQIDLRLERVKAGGKNLSFGILTNLQSLPLDGVGAVLVVTEKNGKMSLVDLESGERNVVLELDGLGNYMEMGLVGVAFHPGFADNRRFFTYKVAVNPDSKDSPAQSVIDEWRLEGDALADMKASAVGTIIRFDQPQEGHQSGEIAFGPDGYFYFPTGDGGFQGDPNNVSQDPTNHYGTVLRLDVDNPSEGKAYSIPPDNPFINGGHLPETWAYGFRNPWRSTFAPDGRYIVADVGQNAMEELNIVVRGGNYGWSLKEGSGCFKPRREREGSCDQADLIDPLFEYAREEGVAVIGGYFYLGSNFPELHGKYVFGDHFSGRIWTLELPETNDGEPKINAAGRTGLTLTTFGVDPDGEILVGTIGGRVYRVVSAP
ncbi:MAG: PQQ-dependent sugar dehydrogenase [Myxococcota bacterium]|nr:PQQ-dependent sugar dehydrogenase [Myxococcota bacterium]